MGKTKMTPEDASRIQSSTAKNNGGKVSSDSFASRAQSSGAKNSNSTKGGGKK